MSRHTAKDLPTIGQLEAELKRINKKRRKSTPVFSRVHMPSPDQVSVERTRLYKYSKKKKNADTQTKASVPSRRTKKRVSKPTMDQVIAEREHLQYKSRFCNILASTIGILLVVAAAAALVATLWLPVLQVSGSSMEPALFDGNIIVLQKTGDFDTGDLVGIHFNGKIMLKRVIGQAGDYVNIDSDGSVYVNGTYINEPYVTGKSLGDCDVDFPLQVPDSTCFVLGDHRSVSADSRNSMIGCIPTDQVIGRIFVRIWPLQDFEIIQ